MLTSYRTVVFAVALTACGHPHESAPPVSVNAPTEIVSTSELPTTRSVAGTVRAATVSPLAAKVMGNILAVHVREGDRVRAGQLLVEIDDREARTQSDRARAGRDAVERAIDGASATVAAAAANAALAATNLARFVDPGAQAAPGMPLLMVEDDRQARVETSAPEDLVVREGDAVAIDAGGKRIAARVTRVVAALDPTARSAIVKIDLPPGAGLRSGTFANVLFTSGARRAVAIPAAAMQQRGALASVFVVGRDGVARLRLITAGDAVG